MKNKILKLFSLSLCACMIFFSGCSSNKSKLNAINLSTYFESSVTCTHYGDNTNTTTVSINDLSSKKPNLDLIGRYTSFSLKANSAWMYKMYIDYIYFYVYTNKSTNSQMTVNVSITNLADESDLKNPTDDFSAECSLYPIQDGSTLCEVKVQKVVATATGSTFTFDIFNTTEIFFDDYGNENNLKWFVHDLEIHGESRSYSK